MRKLLPIILALLGLGLGGGAGLLLRPPPEEVVEINPCGDGDGHEDAMAGSHAEESGHDEEGEAPIHDYVKLNNQFVVPVVEHGDVVALVILSISLEVVAGNTEAVYLREPKLRDVFLQVLFDHANAGGFDGAFTQSNNMDVLRSSLLEVARKIMGSVVTDVLIIDIVRQDG
ncbi:MAG: flagellar basal body-associated FliL family protein [Albidovulum sp.]|uniref:flagellar basal body-associated FliL family protein n=1 Tax=Albidovulum sp. TaxID=1872424 RepID=UPI003CB4201B